MLRGFDFQKEFKIPVTIAATVSNVLDTKYLYKFESSWRDTFRSAEDRNLQIRISILKRISFAIFVPSFLWVEEFFTTKKRRNKDR